MPIQARIPIIAVAGALLLTASAGATIIGPGANITDAGDVDTPNQNRLNVDRSAFITLAPGTYNVDDFGLRVNTHDAPGTIAAMLLTGPPSSYTTLWVGPDLNPTSNGVQAQSFAPGTQQFTLAAPTDVYGGIFTKNNGSAIIGLDSNNSGSGNSRTDHDTSFIAPTSPGESVTGFSNANLGRTYAFQIGVTPTVLSTGGLIGPGAATAGGSADNPGGRTNIEQDFLTLGPGMYSVEHFEFWAVNTSGTVQPFLAEPTSYSPQAYTPIWVGDPVAPTAPGANIAVMDDIIILTETTDVYAGFLMTDTAVGFFGGGFTDHNGGPLSPVVGVELPVFSHNNLPRSYSFGISVERVPEPATLSLLAFGGLGLLRRRKKH